ncbi:helicase [Candidatus Magnetobacterium bavaricum]|uniref:DNA 5'-3' helicase n=1 Tax=Candidatus Magnetobacterium bavaricum TaxID=29290 RepID=A0A0F3GPC3_9BACT|nr:helicase [Candidatus Magnetobacterium bavaricum]
MVESTVVREYLGRTLAGYEYRPQQEEMARAVMTSLHNKTNLLVEAGTGVGKSLAYLISASLWIAECNTRKVVVSTHTKALQRQLYDKDLPFVKQHLFPDITYALCLGSENYLCLRRLHQARQFGLFDVGEAKAFAELLLWANVAVKGIRSETTVDASLWSKVDRESDLCYGKSCKTYRECFYQKAKAIERRSNILVVNHHLFFAHISADSKVLPKFEAVIFDEAHEIEDIAASYLGIEVSNTKIYHLLDTVLSINGKGLLTRLKDIDRLLYNDIISALQAVRNGSELFFLAVADLLCNSNTLRIRKPGCLQDTVSEPLATLQDLLNDLAEASREDDSHSEVLALMGRCAQQRHSIELFLTQGVEDAVYHAERSRTRIKIVVTPVNIAQRLKDSVFSVIDTSVLTSATLSLGGDFSYIKDRLSPCPCDELLLDSPFDYKRQALLYVPSDMPTPRDEGFNEAVTKTVSDILDITRGQTMVLFTSYRLLNEVANAIDSGLTILRQGEMDNYRLIESFRDTDKAALFGTYTFWQGVDFPGDALRCVIIAKLPFAVPTEPVLEGRMEYVVKCGGDPFYDYQVPRAILTLRQGFGRLIRTKTDTGVVAILDSRLRTMAYGRMFLAALPKAKLTDKIKDVKIFYRSYCKK